MKKVVCLFSLLLVGLTSEAVLVVGDHFNASVDGDAANGIYKYNTQPQFTGGILRGSANENVTISGYNGIWDGNGNVSIMQNSGNGYANIYLNGGTSQESREINYAATEAYFTAKISADGLLASGQEGFVGFAYNTTAGYPDEGLVRGIYGGHIGIKSDGSKLSLYARVRTDTANTLEDIFIMDINPNQEYTVVAKIENANNIPISSDRFTVWVNPTDSVEENNIAALIMDDTSDIKFNGSLSNPINYLTLYGDGQSAGNGLSVLVDDVALADGWSDVATFAAIPEPGTVGLLVVSSIALILARRSLRK